MTKEKAEQLKTGDKVKVPQFDCEGVIKSVAPEATEGKGPVYTVELENGETRHFTVEDLK